MFFDLSVSDETNHLFPQTFFLEIESLPILIAHFSQLYLLKRLLDWYSFNYIFVLKGCCDAVFRIQIYKMHLLVQVDRIFSFHHFKEIFASFSGLYANEFIHFHE
jgi:hypothetical protein